jgi:Kelch motif
MNRNSARRALGYVFGAHEADERPSKLIWNTCSPCPVARTEAPSVQIGHELFVIGGYRDLDHVLDDVDVLDLHTGTWLAPRFKMPPRRPHTHVGIATDGQRYVYCVAGQKGPQCHPAVPDCFVLDVQRRAWGHLPPLPEARYSPTVQLWQGRLHALGGSKEDRGTPATEHWSIAVSHGEALEGNWRQEEPIPRGGPHRSSAIIRGKFHVFGGEEGDVRPYEGDSAFTCNWNTPLETVYGDTFVLEPDANVWRQAAAMPVPTTHTEACVLINNRFAALVGGNRQRWKLSDAIQIYDAETDTWRVIERLPYHMKTCAAYHDGWLYVVTGQRSNSPTDLRPGQVLDTVWRARFSA